MTKIYEGAVGVQIILATDQDLEDATKMEIHVTRPDGTEATWPATKDVTPGSIIYTTLVSDLLQMGWYKLQAYVEWGSTSKHLGETVIMAINSEYE
jgi:hypothetical protein